MKPNTTYQLVDKPTYCSASSHDRSHKTNPTTSAPIRFSGVVSFNRLSKRSCDIIRDDLSFQRRERPLYDGSIVERLYVCSELLDCIRVFIEPLLLLLELKFENIKPMVPPINSAYVRTF